jgi:O-antigen/teichoic acid export membrane protein
MEFGKVAIIEIASMSCGLAAGIISTFYASGYWALIIWKIIQVLVATICTWMLCAWRPSQPRKEKGTRTMLQFGGNIAGFKVANYASRNLDNILIGKFWGAQQLGLYGTAYKLLLLPIEQINAPISSVAFPVLSKLKNEPEKFSRYYYKSIAILTFVGMPIVGFTASSIDLIIGFALGNDWLEAVPIFRFLLPAAYIGTFNVAAGWAYVCLGKVKEQMKWGLLSSGLTTILFFVSVPRGATAVAAAYGLSRPLFMLMALAYAYQGTTLSLQKLFKSIQGPFLASSITAVIVLILRGITPLDINNLVLLLLSAISYTLLYLLLWMCFPKGRIFVFSVAKDILKPT